MKNLFEIKNVKTFIGNEGYGLNCSIHVNGKKACFYIDDASGGGGYIGMVYDKEATKIMEQYIASHPEVVSDIGGEPFTYKYCIDNFTDELYKAYEEAKFKRSLAKRMKDSIVIMEPGNELKGYRYYKFSVPLEKYHPNVLHQKVDAIRKQLKGKEYVYNTLPDRVPEGADRNGKAYI